MAGRKRPIATKSISSRKTSAELRAAKRKLNAERQAHAAEKPPQNDSIFSPENNFQAGLTTYPGALPNIIPVKNDKTFTLISGNGNVHPHEITKNASETLESEIKGSITGKLETAKTDRNVSSAAQQGIDRDERKLIAGKLETTKTDRNVSSATQQGIDRDERTLIAEKFETAKTDRNVSSTTPQRMQDKLNRVQIPLTEMNTPVNVPDFFNERITDFRNKATESIKGHGVSGQSEISNSAIHQTLKQVKDVLDRRLPGDCF